MKRFVWLLAVSLFVLIAFWVQAQPKEVTEAVAITYCVNMKALPLDEGRVRMSYEAFGLAVTSTGQGIFHMATSHNLGGMTMEKGVFKDEQGAGLWTLLSGDKVFYTYTFAGASKPVGVGEAKGMVTLTGGTGKCTGIQGSYPATRYTVRTPVEGVVHSYIQATIKYTLP